MLENGISNIPLLQEGVPSNAAHFLIERKTNKINSPTDPKNLQNQDFRPKSEKGDDYINLIDPNKKINNPHYTATKTFYTNMQSKRPKQNGSLYPRILDSRKYNIYDKLSFQTDFSKISKSLRKRFHNNEFCYDEHQKIKQNLNVLKEENTILKTQLLNANEELRKNEKEIERILKGMTSSNNPNVKQTFHANSHLIIVLKRQVKEMKLEIHEKEERIENLSRNLKVSRVQELEVQMQELTDECIRLKQLIGEMRKSVNQSTNEQMISLEGKIKQHAFYENKLEKELEEQKTKMKRIEFENQHLVFLNNDLEKKVNKGNKINQDNLKLKKENIDLRKEIKKQKEMIIQRQENIPKSKFDEQNKKVTEMNEKLKLKSNLLNEASEKIKVLTDQVIKVKENFKKEIAQINENKKKSLNAEKERVKQLECKIKELELKYSVKGGIEIKNEKRNNRIQIDDLKIELKQLRYNMQINNVNSDQIQEKINMSKEIVTNAQLEEILESFPFNLTINSDKLASYIIGNEDEHIKISVFIEKLKELLKGFSYYNERIESDFKSEIKEV